MTEVEQKMDVCLQSHTPPNSPDHHFHNRHTVHNPHTHTPHKRHSPRKHTSTTSKRTLPPGWEVVNSEGGIYYWHKTTGKTTWKFPTSEAKEYKKKQQTHTYINIRPGQKPQVVKQNSVPILGIPDRSTNSGANAMSADTTSGTESVPNGVGKRNGGYRRDGGARRSSLGSRPLREDEGVTGNGGEKIVEEEEEEKVVSRSPEDPEVGGGSQDTSVLTSPPSRETVVQQNGGSPPLSDQGERERAEDVVGLSPSDSPSGVHRRPLIVHHYENFPFSPANSVKQKNKQQQSASETAVSSEAQSQTDRMTSPSTPRSRIGSDTSNASSAPPPLPDRNYSESEVGGTPPPSLPERPSFSLSPSDSPSVSQEQMESDDLFLPPTSSRAREVQRKVSDDGKEYAIINPAWKKNVKGRPPSLGGDNNENAGGKYETPPPLPNHPADLSATTEQPAQKDTRGYVDLDSDIIRKKRAELNISSRFSESVKYSEVKIAPRASSKSLRNRSKVGGDGYEQIDFPEPQRDSNNYMLVGDPTLQSKQSDHIRRMKRNERWLKTQSAHITSLPASSSSSSSHPHTVTATEDTPIYENHTRGRNLTPELSTEEEKPVLPPKPGEMMAEYNAPEVKRRLNAMNVTIRRPSEDSSSSRLKMSKEALLLRSGVTLRPGVRPPRSPIVKGSWEERGGGEGRTGCSGLSGSDEEDGLEPVSKAIKSLESRITADTAAPPTPTEVAGQGKGEGKEEEEKEGGGEEGEDGNMKLTWVREGPPNWKQYQRRQHNYEDVEILDDSPTNHYHHACPRRHDNCRSVGNLHMAWDESDIREQSASKGGNPLVSASQPCLIDPGTAFPHLVKPDRVSDEVFQLRKLRLLQHKYEDIDIPEWADVGVAPGTVGDVNQVNYAMRESWLEAEKESAVTDSGTLLPKGWQRMKDEHRKTYFWHIPSGRTQYTKPTGQEIQRLSLSEESDLSANSSSVSSALSPVEVKGHKFPARYLGYHPVEESDLVPGECVKVVHDSIKKINTAGQHDKGKALFLVIQGMELQWVEPESSCPATIQPINRIRVWGIGLENDRDFGYVARDQVTRKHKCHVFRCDTPARAVAKALLDNHQKMSKPQQQQPSSTSQGVSGSAGENREPQKRAASPEVPSSHELTSSRAVTPPPSRVMENGKTMACMYIGSCEVSRALGIDILNSAVEILCGNKSSWNNVNIDIATSNIRITDVKSEKCIGEHRVRFLCFLGIAKDDRFCGYILESGKKTGEKKFQFHGFMMEPNTDKLCLALHTACQARYQRVLDSNPDPQKTQNKEQSSLDQRTRSKSTSSILGRLGSFKRGKKDEEVRVFTVHYLGSQQVAKSEGLEVVKGPIQQLSVPKSSVSATPTNQVEFEVSSSGLSVVDPQRRLFSRKNFSVKHISYVVRIRNYFAFVVRESSKYQCHVFLESAVDAATIVTTIQRMLAPEPSKKR